MNFKKCNKGSNKDLRADISVLENSALCNSLILL